MKPRDIPSDPFNVEALRLTDQDLDALVKNPSTRPPRHRPGEQFLKGPIPLAWLTAAGRLPHGALQVGVLLWFEAGRPRNRAVTFCLARGEAMGMSKQTTRRALRQLQAAGLVSIARKPGRGLQVTILDVNGETGHEQ